MKISLNRLVFKSFLQLTLLYNTVGSMLILVLVVDSLKPLFGNELFGQWQFMQIYVYIG